MASIQVLAFDHEGRPVQFDTWLDDLQLYLVSDSKDSVSLFDLASSAATAPPATADSRILLPYLFPELSAFATVENLVSHLRASDTRYRAAVPAEFLDKNPPPMYITLYYIVTRLPDSLCSVRDHFLSLDPTSLTVDLLEQHLLAAETSAVAVGAARGTPCPPFFEGCSPSPLAPSYASAAAADISVREDVGAVSASAKRRSSKGKGGRGGGGGSGGGGGGSGSGGGGSSRGGGGGGTVGGSGGSCGGVGGIGGSGGSGGGGTCGGGTGARRVSSGCGQRHQQQRRGETPSPQQLREWFLRGASGGSCLYVIRTGDRAGQTYGRLHTQHRCFSRLDDAWRAEFGDEVDLPRWADLLKSRIAIFDLDFDAILSAMYALSVSAEGDCYRCMPPDPGIAAAALGVNESGTLPGTAPAEALHTFTLDSGASRCFFCNSTTLTPLPAPVPVRLADPSRGPVMARSSTVLLCPAVLSGSLSGLHLPSFSTNLVSTAALQDAMVTITTPGGQRVSICTCTRTGRHLATFTRWPGSSLYTLTTEPSQVVASTQVSASSQVAASCSCRLLSHQTLLWHHRLGHPSLPRLRGMHSRLLVSGLPRSLPPLPPLPALPCLPCVEGRQRAAPHSSFPPTTAPLQTLYMDVWGLACVSGQSRERYFLLVVDDYMRYTTIFPLRSKDQVVDVLIPWIRTVSLQLRERFTLIEVVSSPPTSCGTFVMGRAFSSRDPLSPQGLAPSGVSQVDPLPGRAPVQVAVDSGAARGAASGGAEPGGAESEGSETGGAELGGVETGGTEPGGVALGGGEPGGAEREGVEPGGAASEGAESGGADPHGAASFGGSAGASPSLSLQQLREWFVRRTRLWSGASGAGGACPAGAGGPGVAAGAGVTGGTATTGPGGACTWGIGAAGTGGDEGTGAGDLAESSTTGAGGAGAGGARVGGLGAGGAGVGGPGVGGAGAGGAGAVDPGGAVRPRPYFVPLLQQVLGTPPFAALTPPLQYPPPDQSQPPFQLASPLPAPSSYTEHSGGLTECHEPVSRPVLPVCTARRVPCLRTPCVLGTHAMTLRPSSVPLRLPLPAPPESSLPEAPDPESDRARAASPTVSRLLATAVTDPSFESAAASALVAELLDFAAACRLDYATALVAESASASPTSVGGECALGTDVLEDRQEDFESPTAAVPRFASMLLAPEGDPDAPDIATPRSYAEAITGPYSSQWQAAMDVEMASWKSTGTYIEEVPPPGANLVDGMCIFRAKRPPGSLPAFKARYVARGFNERQGVDYFQTFSPTPKMTTLRSPREWHDTLRTTLGALGFAPADPSLFLRTDTSLPPFYVLVYVHDLVFATGHTEALTLVKSELQKRHTCTDLGEMGSYLGLQITRDRARRTITWTLSQMVHQVLQRFGFQFSLPQATPLSTSHSLSAPPSNESVEPSGPYPKLVGCLMHRKVHWDAAKRVLRYLCSSSGMGLVLGGRGPVVLTGHVDASWVDDSATQRSSQGYTFSLGSGSVSWWSTRSFLVLNSSCEADFYAGAMAAQELRWLTYLLTDLGEQPRSPPVLYVDNKAIIALCHEHRLEHRTKHIALRYFLAQELQQRGQLHLAYMATRDNTADIFTKALPPGDHQRFVTVLGLVPTLPHLLTD
ncbi:unnamed protein product [Closterium sp. NIES-54]